MLYTIELNYPSGSEIPLLWIAIDNDGVYAEREILFRFSTHDYGARPKIRDLDSVGPDYNVGMQPPEKVIIDNTVSIYIEAFAKKASDPVDGIDNDYDGITDENISDGDYSGAILRIQRDGDANATDGFGLRFKPDSTLSEDGYYIIATDPIGHYTSQNGVMTIYFGGESEQYPSQAMVDEIMQSITYENSSEITGFFGGYSATLKWMVTDTESSRSASDTIALSFRVDGDDDGVLNSDDNCPYDPNPDQADTDTDGIGDVCDPCPNDTENDIDEDGVCGDVDNCPYEPNADQSNIDGDSLGDACDSDIDGDSLINSEDNCPSVANADQSNRDGDPYGDACDLCVDLPPQGQDLLYDPVYAGTIPISSPFNVFYKNRKIYATTENDTVVVMDSNGSNVKAWGGSGTGDGEFHMPQGITADDDGNIYVGDAQNHRVQKFDSNGTFIKTWGTQGSNDGEFSYASGVCIGQSDELFVSDFGNKRVQVWTLDGLYIRSMATPDNPSNIICDGNGMLYVALAQVFTNGSILKMEENGTIVDRWTSAGGTDYTLPAGLALDGESHLITVDRNFDGSMDTRLMVLDIADGSMINQWEQINNSKYLGLTTDILGRVWIGNSDANVETYFYRHQDLNNNGIGDICDPNGPFGDNDGDGIINKDDIYPNDGPLGDWDGDGILNNVDTDDSDGFGANDPRAHYSQGIRTEDGRISGNKEQDTQPYPENPCGRGNPCIQGTTEWNPDAVDDMDEPVTYPGRPDCDAGEMLMQGQGCVDQTGCTDDDGDGSYVGTKLSVV